MTDPPPIADQRAMSGDSVVVPLTRLDPAALAEAGGKATSLAAMLRAGLPVPPGFVVTIPAYRAFIALHGLDEAIAALPRDRLPEAEAAALRARIIAAEMPAGCADAVTAAWREMGGGPVAVRSSATAEDLPGASFAGQHDSFLNIADAPALLDAVRRCWASLWNPRAIAYRRQQGLDTPDVALAVVVQRLADAERAGVLFTANPLDHRRDRMLLSASFGLAEAEVSGAVILCMPDRDRRSRLKRQAPSAATLPVCQAPPRSSDRNHLVRHRVDQRPIMAHQNQAESLFLHHLPQQQHRLALHDRIEARGRLVGQDEVRFQQKQAQDGKPLRLAAGDLGRIALEQPRRELQPIEQRRQRRHEVELRLDLAEILHLADDHAVRQQGAARVLVQLLVSLAQPKPRPGITIGVGTLP